jgi:predicted nucleotidyltransferase component of viral defense system
VIGKQDILDRAAEWQLRPDVVEKDYVLGWLLWAIGSEPAIREHWVFKGGTCLKKCYIETYRFSEDLDFTVLEDGPLGPDDVLPILRAMLARVNQESGIDFAVEGPRLGCSSNPSGDQSRTRTTMSSLTPRRCDATPT